MTTTAITAHVLRDAGFAEGTVLVEGNRIAAVGLAPVDRMLRCRPRDTKSPGRHFIPDRSFASIGYGLPGGIGAVLGRQEPRCIATISLVGEFYVLCRYSLAIVERRATAQHEFVAETIRGGCVGRRSPTRRRHAARRRELSGVPVAVVTGQHCGAGPPLHIKNHQIMCPTEHEPERGILARFD